MRCEEIALLLPAVVDGDEPVALSVQRHVESCLRCQAELARYRRMLRGLQLMRTQFFEPAPGLLAQTLAVIGEASERRAIRSLLTRRRLAYAGAIGGALAAAGATAAAVAVHRARRRAGSLATS
jgi:anti-sigma factor RsiW